MSPSTTDTSTAESTVPPGTRSRFRPGGEGRKFRGPASVGTLGLGVAVLWLRVIVLLPLAALTVQSFDDGLSGFWDAISEPRAVATFKVTLEVSVAAAVLNLFLGTLIAWVLVRDEFPGKRFVNALIDLPFALPTIVASLVLLSLYGPASPIGLVFNATKPAVVVALLFVTLPFVVRAVQPVLIELDKDVEEAAASLGANNWTIFRRIVLPVLLPAVLSGGGLAFARAIGEFGSVVLIGGNIPNDTQVASQYIRELIEYDRSIDAAAISVVLLGIAFAVLFVLRVVGNRLARREEQIS